MEMMGHRGGEREREGGGGNLRWENEGQGKKRGMW